MWYAFLSSKHHPIHASDARRGNGYVCPTCRGAVFLRAGGSREPHFAHNVGGDPSCEDYHPGAGTTIELTHAAKSAASSFAPVLEEERAPRKLGLGLSCEAASGWQLFLRVPELRREHVPARDLEKLAQFGVRVMVGRRQVATLTALDLLPGTGVARAPISPGAEPYEVEPYGRWPKAAGQGDWTASASGLAPAGSLFRLVHGEWTRVRERSSVTWGEAMRVVTRRGSPSPPAACALKSVGERRGSEGAVWVCWEVSLPVDEHAGVREWLATLNVGVLSPPWRLTLSTSPLSSAEDEDVFAAGAPIIVEVRPPSARAFTTARLISHSGQQALTVQPSAAPTYLSIEAGAGARLFLSDERADVVALPTAARLTVEELRRDLGRIPRLRVRINSEVVNGWGVLRVRLTATQAVPSVEISFGDAAYAHRISLRWTDASGTVTYRGDAETAHAKLIEALTRQATRVEIDAGALGRVEITTHVAVGDTKTGASRRDRTFGYAANLTTVSGDGMTVLPRAGKCIAWAAERAAASPKALLRRIARDHRRSAREGERS